MTNALMPADTIVALSTPNGSGAIAVIRLSGEDAIAIVDGLVSSKKLLQAKGYSLHFVPIKEGETLVDDVLVSVFRAPRSYTKENLVEISCHGSPFIINKILQLCCEKGARPAQPGEFSQRAFLNGQFDLVQAEAVADLIASESAAAHKIAMQQLKGGFSKDIERIREKLVDFASLIELELDFGEEDVEFANREELKNLIKKTLAYIGDLIDSFEMGNAIKKGIPVVIAGKPNVGKSTLLNALLNEEKAIVSDIAGTTRDIIEDRITVDGIDFRFIDTAGLRTTQDKIEAIGVNKAKSKMDEAHIILYVFDVSEENKASIQAQLDEVKNSYHAMVIPIINKVDHENQCPEYGKSLELFAMSAQSARQLPELKSRLITTVNAQKARGEQTVISNIRHHAALKKTHENLTAALYHIEEGITSDFVAMDIRQALYHLGEITGTVHVDELLGNIFGKFCIGK